MLKLKNIGRIIRVEMMPRSTSYHEKLIQDLKDPLEAAAYIEVVLEEGDPKMLNKALRNVIESQGGIEQLSVPVQQCYQKFNQTLSKNGEIEFYLGLTHFNERLGLEIASLRRNDSIGSRFCVSSVYCLTMLLNGLGLQLGITPKSA